MLIMMNVAVKLEWITTWKPHTAELGIEISMKTGNIICLPTTLPALMVWGLNISF